MKIESLNLYSLKYFFDAVDAGSLTKASEANFVTRSAVSQAITRLEQWAGKRLTTHEKKRLELTEEGEMFYRQMREAFKEFEKSIRSTASKPGDLRIGCSNSLIEPVLLPALKKIRPANSLHLVTGTSSFLKARLDDDDINISISINEEPKTRNTLPVRSGHFVLASPSGKISDQVITTELRPEVIKLKRHLVKLKNVSPNYMIVESWSLAAKIATSLGHCCLIPDFLMGNTLKPIAIAGFRFPYKANLSFKNREFLSKSEITLVDTLTN